PTLPHGRPTTQALRGSQPGGGENDRVSGKFRLFQSVAPLAREGAAPHIPGVQAIVAAQIVKGSAPWADRSHFAQQRGNAMRTFDLAPLYRSTVGFDRLFSMLDAFDSAPGYPPYNIERTGENAYRISVAVAGFSEKDISIEAKENTLTIKGE